MANVGRWRFKRQSMRSRSSRGSAESLESFKVAQNYDAFDPEMVGASIASPAAAFRTRSNVGDFAAGVISVTQPNSYTRIVTVRSVGWLDVNSTGVLDTQNEPYKTVDVTATFSLERSKVFDYTYFVNNYG